LRKSVLIGSVLALAAGTLWSMGVLTVRLATEADAWQYLMWRSVGLLIAIEIWSLAQRREFISPRAFTSGWLIIAGSACIVLASFTYIFALKTTTVANTVFLASTTPLVASVMAWFVLKEKLTLVGALTIAIACIGLLVMVNGQLGGGKMIGDIAALASAIGFAGYAICTRLGPKLDWQIMLPCYALMTFPLCLAFTLLQGKPVFPPLYDISLAMFHGAVFITIGTSLFNLASRRISAVAMVVFAQIEAVLGPLWVFLALGEKPAATALLGGGIILAAIFIKAVFDKSGEARG
jgi:drug/metabolite transporter, DME family